MENLQSLKSLVRTVRNNGHDHGLTYTQHLDAACRLLYGAESLNHFAAKSELPTNTDKVPQTITEILGRLQNAESLFKFAPAGPVPGYERFDKWLLGAEVWVSCLGMHGEMPALLVLLKGSPDIESIMLPGIIKSDGSLGSILDEDADLPLYDQLNFIIHGWLPVHASRESNDTGFLIQRWDELQGIALRAGLKEGDANYYRSICRESFNHTWSLQSMAALGVLDINISAGSFFAMHPVPADAVNAMKGIWNYEEPGWDD